MSGPLDRLALLRAGVRTKRISSYDRTGGNADCITIEAGDNRMIAEMADVNVVP